MSTSIPIAKISPEWVGKKIQTWGRLHNLRGKGKMMFLILRDQLDSFQALIHRDRVNPEQFKALKQAPKESMILIQGELRASMVEVKFTSHSTVEMDADEVHILSLSEQIPFQIDDANEADESTRSSVTRSTRLDHRWLDLRTPVNNSIFQIQSEVCQLFREFLLADGFREIHTPKTIGCASESGASVFKLNYFDKEAYLTQSPQLYKQMAINSDFGRVFEIGPVFRAEEAFSHRHLCEFTGLDLEMEIDPGQDYTQVQTLLWNLLVFIFRGLQKRCARELGVIKSKLGLPPFRFTEEPTILDFATGVKMLREAGVEQEMNADLNTENERRLGELVAEKYGVDLYILTRYPREARPFYTMTDPETPEWTYSYDIMMRNEEIASGAQRIHDYKQLMSEVESREIDPKSLAGYLDSFRLGSKPHGGAGFGLERIVMLFLGLNNVRQTSFCPRDPKRLFP